MNASFPLDAYLNAWKKIFSGGFEKHVQPGCMIAGATALMTMLRDRNQAAGFFCAATALYPITQHQIKRLIQVDLHETLLGIAFVVIEVFRKHFPHLGFLTLPMTLVLAYAVVMKGIALRSELTEQQSKIKAAESTNGKLGLVNKGLEVRIENLVNEIEKLRLLQQESQSLEHKACEIQNGNAQTTSNVVYQLRELVQGVEEITDNTHRVENGNNPDLANLVNSVIGQVSEMQKNTQPEVPDELSLLLNEEQRLQAQLRQLIEVEN